MYPVKDALIIIGLTLGVVILINVGIIVAYRRGDSKRDMPYKSFGQALNIFKNPWKKENEQIDELSNLLDSIEEKSEHTE